MKSLFLPADNAEAVARIRSLQPDARPLWGKLNAPGMLAHCRQAFRTASGELELKRGVIGILFGGLVKRVVLGPKPFRRNLPTDPAFVVAAPEEFAREQTQLVDAVERFARGGPAAVTPRPHPFFGKMDPAQWDRLMWKHLDHHLQQFGA